MILIRIGLSRFPLSTRASRSAKRPTQRQIVLLEDKTVALGYGLGTLSTAGELLASA
jgi:hypothetical protein